MSEIFIKNNPQPIYVYEKESLRFLNVNEAALKIYGYTMDEFIQMDLTDLYTSEDIQTLLESAQEIFKDGEFSKPFKHRRKDGNYIYVRMSRIDYQHEGSEAYLNILEDVSYLYETEKKKQIFKAAFDNTNDMILITDPEGTITYVNDSACKILGTSSSDLMNTDITLNCGEEDKIFINDSVFHSHIKETVTFTIEFITAEGRLLECDVVSTPIFDTHNHVESFVLVAKPAIQQGNSNSRIKEESKEPNNKSKNQNAVEPESDEIYVTGTFLSGIFHEILTPMNVILGFTQELVESIASPTPEQKEAVDIINQNRVLILGLMNTIIEYSDIHFNRSKIEMSEVVITEIIENYEKSLNEITSRRDLEFAYGKISSSLRFNIDKKKFLNLMNNLFRIIGRISSQKKLYFSAYPAENYTFNISISDGFGRSSDQLVETLRSLFIEKKEPKHHGLSNLTFQIISSLLETLNVQLLVINENTDKHDIVFRFPLNLTQKVETPEVKEVEKFVPQITEAQPELLVEDSEPKLLTISEEIEIEEEEIISSANKGRKRANVNTIELKEEVKVYNEEPDELLIAEEKVDANKKTDVPKNKNGLSSLRCLYIEDQVDSQILFKVQMKDLKNIQFATSFEEALPLLETNVFDFIIMDINLQGEYNGLDALKVIHQIPKFQSIPVIAVTAYVLPGDKEKFIATGFTDFISKPIFREKLVESLNKIFVN
ncbi:MAG: PAS domain S-box protein [Ignavibacteriaceae bacterium]|jgi:PAS domain S-box-containing protein|nr:PAS domain S-box protein [Ignavibacteriaceae bacterium]